MVKEVDGGGHISLGKNMPEGCSRLSIILGQV